MPDDQRQPLPPDVLTGNAPSILIFFAPVRPESELAGSSALLPGFQRVQHLDETEPASVDAFIQEIRAGADVNLVADLRNTGFINTAKLGLLVRLRAEVAAKNGEVVVLCKEGELRDVLQITRLDRLLRVVTC